MNLNKLTELCAGAEKKTQEAFLENVLLKVMIDKFGRGCKLPDENAIPAVLENMPVLDVEYVRENPVVATKILDAFYKIVSKLLLEDTNFDMLDLRSTSEAYLAKELERRENIKAKAKEVSRF